METYEVTRFIFQRAYGFIYLVMFLNIVNQFRPLCGRRGLLPAHLFLKRVTRKQAPSVFWYNHSDAAFAIAGWGGVVLSILALSGLSDSGGYLTSIGTWFLLWLLYLSFVNVGQTFFAFGWESMILEGGFLCIFWGPTAIQASPVLSWLYAWMLFRVMFGAGLIKLRGDPCWRDLTCLYYHYETQPIPNPLSWYFHHLPRWFHRASVAITHFLELVVPWGFFLPAPYCTAAALLTAFLMFTLILSGNLSVLNYLTIVLCLPLLNDAFYTSLFSISLPAPLPLAGFHFLLLVFVCTAVVLLSVRPIQNLLSSHQAMNYSYDAWHLVNTYGAFGSVTKKRYEVVIQGTNDAPNDNANWKEYKFKGKPGDVTRRPCLMSPYHYRLDWLLWFAAMGSCYQFPWIIHLMAKFLQGDTAILKLIASNPFPEKPPRYIKADWYLYEFTDRKTHDGRWWKRTYVDSYFTPADLDDARIRRCCDLCDSE